MPDKDSGKRLVKIARDSIASYFEKKDVSFSDEDKERFKEKLGVFVTLKIGDELRGCIGFVEGVSPLYEGVAGAAKSAAFSDPRFTPLTKDEFKKVRAEVSVLTKPELIDVEKAEDYMEKIKIGEDGLIIKGSHGSGLLLPQVPSEWGWNVKEFLENLCMKAGLNKDEWKELENKVYKFQAEVFEEG